MSTFPLTLCASNPIPKLSSRVPCTSITLARRFRLFSLLLSFATLAWTGGGSTGHAAENDRSYADDDHDDDERESSATNPVLQWNKVLLGLVRTPGVQPATVHSTRSFAIMHAAIYDSVNSIDPSHQPFLVGHTSFRRPASKNAAAAAAAHAVLIALYPAQKANLDAELEKSLAAISTKEDRKVNGQRIGEAVAQRILAQRANDHSNAPAIPFVFTATPGRYQSTPPNFPPQPVFTHWSQVVPFVLQRADKFRPNSPPALASPLYAKDFNEIKTVGIVSSTTRTADQTEIGRFWAGPIQNYWNEIAQTAAQKRNLNTAESARLFALLDLAIADAVIAFYDAKYAYAFWRPVTAIRAADTDGNAKTDPDSNWLPLAGNTPPDPSYPGAHAVISGAAAFVLSEFFGRTKITLPVTSETLPNVVRSFASFSDAAAEASLSRVFAGVHFRFDETVGDELGEQVGDYVEDHALRPLHRRD